MAWSTVYYRSVMLAIPLGSFVGGVMQWDKHNTQIGLTQAQQCIKGSLTGMMMATIWPLAIPTFVAYKLLNNK